MKSLTHSGSPLTCIWAVAQLLLLQLPSSSSWLAVAPTAATTWRRRQRLHSSFALNAGGPTELPDSLEDAAVRAAEASAQYANDLGGVAGRCRVDFDTSVGDETFTLLKTSTEFMQNFVSALCYAMIPGLQEAKQAELVRVVEARAALKELETQEASPERDAQEEALVKIISSNGRDENAKWEGPKARIYFPDEGNAALARRDWLGNAAGGTAKVPVCVEFASCGGVQRINDVKNDTLVFFFCPKASESEYVEAILQRSEMESECLQLSVFVNPNLVDMGVTGFGMAGRMLRERLLDPLVQTYYLRTLAWGALTRRYPEAFSVWQEDEAADGGYRLIQTLDRLPSNPEVEDIYDVENGTKNEKASGGFLDQLGDFVQGMTRL